MRKAGAKLEDVKKEIERLKGKSVALEVARGRKKPLKICGVVESLYPSIFTIRCSEGGPFSYSYAEVLCGSVKFEELA